MRSVHWNFCVFKHEPTYEVRISEWSSDVCASELLLQCPHHREADHLFVVNNQYSWHSGYSVHELGGHRLQALHSARGRKGHFFLQARQVDRKGWATPWRAVDVDEAARGSDNSVAARQPEAGDLSPLLWRKTRSERGRVGEEGVG